MMDERKEPREPASVNDQRDDKKDDLKKATREASERDDTIV
jgi:hypothetical protein